MKIYLVTIGSRGDFEPFYAFAKIAASKGHEVHLAVTEEFAPEVKSDGINTSVLPGTIKQFVDSNGVSIFKNLVDFLPRVRPMIVKILETISKQILEIRPDVVLYHPSALTAPIAARYLKSLSVLVEIIPILSPTKEFASAGLWTSDLKFLNRLTYLGVKVAEKIFYFETKKLAKELNVKKLNHDIAISLVSPAILDRPKDWPNNSYVVGPWHQTRDEELTQELTDFVKRKETIYAGFGSMKRGNSQKLARTIINTCEKLGLQVIISKGWGGLEVPVEMLNKDFVRFVPGAPHEKLFPKLKAVIHHGGGGTVHASLRAGTPSIIAPFVVDQPWWADRLYRAGLGPKALRLRKFNEKNLKKRIIGIDKYKNEVLQVAEKMRSDQGAENTLNLIIDLIQGRGLQEIEKKK